MTIDIPEEMVPMIVHAFAQNPALRGFVKAELALIAAELKGEDDLLTPVQAAELLGVTRRTLQDNHREWGLDKSVAFGVDKPFYFRSQIVARAKQRVVASSSRFAREREPLLVIDKNSDFSHKGGFVA